ncbi:MucBP domain-containing protein [Weissella minor]|uniref:MucBP domain-containing protein n=1 Tax=Weissella minor TaxID=1620 RepID=UPI003AF2B2BF
MSMKKTEKAQTVTYFYTKDSKESEKAADVTAKYVDEDGKELTASETVSGNVGDDYKTEQKKIDGYTFKEVKGNPTGKLTDKAQTVTYVYTKNNGASETNNSGNLDGKDTNDSHKSNKHSLGKQIQNGVDKLLPNTAEKQQLYLSALGVIVLVTGTLFYFKKHK